MSEIWLRAELLDSRLSAGEEIRDPIRWINLDEALLQAGGDLRPGRVTLSPALVGRFLRWRIAGLRPLVATCTFGDGVTPADGGMAALEIDALTGGSLDAIRIVAGHPVPPDRGASGRPSEDATFDPPAGLTQEVRERIRGALLGVAVGDSLGAPVENWPPEKIARFHGAFRDYVGGRGWGPGSPTRETTQALLWFREFASGRTVHRAEDRDRLAREMARWVVGRPRDFGHLTRGILQGYLDGPAIPAALAIWHRAERKPEFNAALSRAAAVGIAAFHDQDLRWGGALAASAMTHPAPVCLASAVAVADGIAAAIGGADPLEAARASAWHEATSRALDEAAEGWAPGGGDWNGDGRSHPLKSLMAAFWAARKEASFEEILLDLVHRGGDADTHAALAGAMLGAARGVDAIPSRWLDGLQVRDLVEGMARRYFDRSARDS